MPHTYFQLALKFCTELISPIAMSDRQLMLACRLCNTAIVTLRAGKEAWIHIECVILRSAISVEHGLVARSRTDWRTDRRTDTRVMDAAYCSDIKGTELPPANILISLERQLIELQFAADSFYIIKLCSRLLVLYCLNLYERRQI